MTLELESSHFILIGCYLISVNVKWSLQRQLFIPLAISCIGAHAHWKSVVTTTRLQGGTNVKDALVTRRYLEIKRRYNWLWIERFYYFIRTKTLMICSSVQPLHGSTRSPRSLCYPLLSHQLRIHPIVKIKCSTFFFKKSIQYIVFHISAVFCLNINKSFKNNDWFVRNIWLHDVWSILLHLSDSKMVDPS